MGFRDKLKELTKKAARRAAAEVYWRIGAKEEDNYAKNFIIYQEVPADANTDLIVAEIDKVAAQRGGTATRILRDIRGEGPNGQGKE